MINRLFRIANIFKPNKFHLALVNYLADELRANNIKCRKKDSYIKIKLDKPIDKYESLIIDCFNGKMYLRDDDNNDKKVLRLNRFYGNRESDAMHCAKGGVKQIMKYLEDVNIKKDLIIEANEHKSYIDMRSNYTNFDIEKLLAQKYNRPIIARRDINDRDKQDGAIVYIDGNIMAASTHAGALHKYLTEHGSEGLFDPFNRPIGYDPDLSESYAPKIVDLKDMNEIENNINQLGFAHKDSYDMKIYLETDTLQNVDATTVANKIKEVYPDYDILTDETEEKIANLSRLKKKSGVLNRDFAIAIIDGKVYDGDTHGEAITKYLNDIGVEGISVYDRDELESIMGYGFKNQFAAAHVKGDNIFIEPTTLENISLDEATNLINLKYPQYNIYNVDTNERLAILSRLKKSIISKSNKYPNCKVNVINDWHGNKELKEKLKDNKSRLKRIAWHDVSNRDNAMVYIDNKIYEGNTHAECISNYLQDNTNSNKLNDTQYRPNINIEVDDAWDDLQAEDLQNIYDNIKQMAFCHKDTKNKIIYIEPEGYNTSQSDIKNIGENIKQQYPEYEILLDNAINDNFEKVAVNINKLEKVATDIGDRDYEGAIAYIDGELYEARTHAVAINNYIKKQDLEKELNEKWCRPLYNIENKDNVDIESKEDHDLIEQIIHQLAFAHKVSDEYNGYKDNGNGSDMKTIFLETDTLQNVDVNTVVEKLKQKYPDYIILNDATQEKIARLKKIKLKKQAYHDKNNRTSAIMYLEGEVLEGPDHYDMINKYLIKNYNLDRDNSQQEREANDIFDNLSYAMGSKVDEDKTIYIDTMTINNIDESTVINSIKAKYPNYNVELEETNDGDMNDYVKNYTGYTMQELIEKEMAG